MANVVLIQEHCQLLHGNSEVSLVEFVRNVPTKWTELASFLDQGVEETKSKQHPLPCSLNIPATCLVHTQPVCNKSFSLLGTQPNLEKLRKNGRLNNNRK